MPEVFGGGVVVAVAYCKKMLLVGYLFFSVLVGWNFRFTRVKLELELNHLSLSFFERTLQFNYFSGSLLHFASYSSPLFYCVCHFSILRTFGEGERYVFAFAVGREKKKERRPVIRRFLELSSYRASPLKHRHLYVKSKQTSQFDRRRSLGTIKFQQWDIELYGVSRTI